MRVESAAALESGCAARRVELSRAECRRAERRRQRGCAGMNDLEFRPHAQFVRVEKI
jgi:hypothetical protein